MRTGATREPAEANVEAFALHPVEIDHVRAEQELVGPQDEPMVTGEEVAFALGPRPRPEA